MAAPTLTTINDDAVHWILDQISKWDNDNPHVWNEDSEAFRAFKSLSSVNKQLHVQVKPWMFKRLELKKAQFSDTAAVAGALEKSTALQRHLRAVKVGQLQNETSLTFIKKQLDKQGSWEGFRTLAKECFRFLRSLSALANLVEIHLLSGHFSLKAQITTLECMTNTFPNLVTVRTQICGASIVQQCPRLRLLELSSCDQHCLQISSVIDSNSSPVKEEFEAAMAAVQHTTIATSVELPLRHDIFTWLNTASRLQIKHLRLTAADDSLSSEHNLISAITFFPELTSLELPPYLGLESFGRMLSTQANTTDEERYRVRLRSFQKFFQLDRRWVEVPPPLNGYQPMAEIVCQPMFALFTKLKQITINGLASYEGNGWNGVIEVVREDGKIIGTKWLHTGAAVKAGIEQEGIISLDAWKKKHDGQDFLSYIGVE